MTPMTHRPSSQISRELAQVQNAPPPAMPNIGLLQAKINKLTTMTALEPEKYRADLWQATHDLEDAHRTIAAIGERNRSIDLLQKELEQALQQERMQRVAMVDQQLNTAINEFQHSCLIAAKSLRTLLNAQKRSSQVAGASSNLEHLRIHQFNIPGLMPMSWSGTLGQTMLQSLAPFEQTRDDMVIRPDFSTTKAA